MSKVIVADANNLVKPLHCRVVNVTISLVNPFVATFLCPQQETITGQYDDWHIGPLLHFVQRRNLLAGGHLAQPTHTT